MILFIAIGFFIICTIGRAIASDWEKGQRNLYNCSSQIADAIYDGSSRLSGSIEQSAQYLITDEEKELMKKFKNKEIENYTDMHGRKMRTRILYNEHGIPIAEERIEIQE